MLRWNVEPTGCSNTCLRMSSRTSSAMLRWSSTVPSHFDFRISGPFGSCSPAATLCHQAFGSAVSRLCSLSLFTALNPVCDTNTFAPPGGRRHRACGYWETEYSTQKANLLI